jgi:hypothetical protein
MGNHSEDNTVVVTLEGGPATLPQTMTVEWSKDLCKIKLPHGNGYEHYELVEPTATTGSRPVFRWTTRTKIAE